MKLTAKNDKQLGMCLRVLYAEGLNNLPIAIDQDKNGKLYFNITFSIDEDRFRSIKAKYELLISK